MQHSRTIVAVVTVLFVALVSFWGCQDQPTAPAATDNTQLDIPMAKVANPTPTFIQNWHSGGSVSFTNGSGGNFKASWSNVGDAVLGKGWQPGGTYTVGYNVGVLSGYHCCGIYGWTTNPLIEFYITEFGANGGTKVNTVSSDGHTYTFYKQQRVNAPSIQGTKTFWQYKDSWGGSSTGSNHTITMSNHVNNWKSKGGQGFGGYNNVTFSVEAMNQSGSINATVW
jgi:endo-1,4-beta-xylanase